MQIGTPIQVCWDTTQYWTSPYKDYIGLSRFENTTQWETNKGITNGKGWGYVVVALLIG